MTWTANPNFVFFTDVASPLGIAVEDNCHSQAAYLKRRFVKKGMKTRL
jgi:hypothetical protein